jgi:exosortase H (IPTLxxWG-CTERM-specific)
MSLDGRTNDVKKRSKKEQPGLSWPAFAAEWRSWWTAKAPVLFFGAKFGALVALLYILLAIPSVEQALLSYLKAYAWASSAILDLFGQGTHVTDVTIASSSSFAIAIRRGCDAVEPTWLLCAAIIAFPGSWRRKWAGLFAGIIALQALNLVRIVSLYLIGRRFPAIFPSAHLEIWPTVFILAAIGLFFHWVNWKGGAHEK